MIQTLKITCFCLLILSIVSCVKEIPIGQEEGETVSFSIAPTIVEAEAGTGELLQADTRSMVTGTVFPNGAKIGLSISAPSASPSISSVYDNFFGMYNGATWFYYLGNVNTGDRLSGFSSWGVLDVYGYYPYDATATDLTAIPFRIATPNGSGVAEGTNVTVSTDYMVAETRTKDMTIALSGDVPLRFRHMMTSIELDINRSISSVPYLTMTKVTYQISGGSRKFTVSGTYNAINPDVTDLGGNITPGDEASTMSVSYLSVPDINSGSVTRILLLIMPELRQTSEADDATIKMTFEFIDQDGTPYVFEEFVGGNPFVEFKLSGITNTGNDNGLLAGWNYAVKATLGYYTKFAAPSTEGAMPPYVNYVPLIDDQDNEFVDI